MSSNNIAWTTDNVSTDLVFSLPKNEQIGNEVELQYCIGSVYQIKCQDGIVFGCHVNGFLDDRKHFENEEEAKLHIEDGSYRFIQKLIIAFEDYLEKTRPTELDDSEILVPPNTEPLANSVPRSAQDS